MHDLLLPIQWVVGGGFWSTFVICLIICPIIPQLLGVVFASYWAPWSPRYQFLSYIPGNPFLALFIAAMSTTLPGGNVDLSPALNYAALSDASVLKLRVFRNDSSGWLHATFELSVEPNRPAAHRRLRGAAGKTIRYNWRSV
jgi:hypothetical protein